MWSSSGITDAQAARLQFEPLTSEETQHALATARPQPASVKIPYFDFDGQPTSFFRVRYLGKLPGFAGLVEKPQRYAQQAGTINEVYLPPLLEVPWREAASDPKVPIFITEGEKKAAAACAVGLACLGLGGVDVWRAKKKGLDFLPQLAEIEWTERQVVIVYDSDAATNPNVVRAEQQLARELVIRGAKVSIASLPSADDGGKQGLDDLLVAKGPDALLEILGMAPPYEESAALWDLNSEVLYVRDPGFIVVRDTGLRLDAGGFVKHAYANRHYTAIKIEKGGTEKRERKPLAPRWLAWEHRAEVARITYRPGQPDLVDGEYNAWPGWGCEPKPGDITPWKWLLDFLFKGEHEAREWFERWCAYPIQHPGTKLYTAVVLWSREKGMGKSAVAYALRSIYGDNAVEIKSKDLKGGFNQWASNRQFVIGDEITGGQARVDSDWLKGTITQPFVRINEKHKPEYVIPDCINYIFNSNHPDALFLEEGDRRYFVHEVRGVPATKAQYDVFDRWLNGEKPNSGKGPGPSALFHHLLHLDLGDFTPNARAPETVSKREMILNSMSDLAAWVAALREDPWMMIRPLGERVAKECELLTPSQLVRCYDPDGRQKVTAPGMGRALVNAGIRQVNGCGTVRTSTGTVRLYAIRNAEKWETASPREMAAHWESFFGEDGGRF